MKNIKKPLFSNTHTFVINNSISVSAVDDFENLVHTSVRKIEISDFNSESNGMSIDSSPKSKSDILAIRTDFSLKKKYIQELNDYYGYAGLKIDEKTFNSLTKFFISSVKIVDYRGCRTQQSKQSKLRKVSRFFQDLYDATLEMRVQVEIQRVHDFIESIVYANNTKYESCIIKKMSASNNWIDKFNEIPSYNELQSRLSRLNNQAIELKKQIQQVKFNLSMNKKLIVLKEMNDSGCCLKDDNGNMSRISEQVIKNIEKAMNEGDFFDQ